MKTVAQLGRATHTGCGGSGSNPAVFPRSVGTYITEDAVLIRLHPSSRWEIWDGWYRWKCNRRHSLGSRLALNLQIHRATREPRTRMIAGSIPARPTRGSPVQPSHTEQVVEALTKASALGGSLTGPAVFWETQSHDHAQDLIQLESVVSLIGRPHRALPISGEGAIWSRNPSQASPRL